MTLRLVTDCGCRCCEEGEHCAHVLKLSPKDHADLARFERQFGERAAWGINLSVTPSAFKAKADPPEPMNTVRCGDCRRDFQIFAYVADVLRRHHFTPMCRDCAGANKFDGGMFDGESQRPFACR